MSHGTHVYNSHTKASSMSTKGSFFFAALDAAQSNDPERCMVDGSNLGTDAELREGHPAFLYGAYHLCHVVCATARGDHEQEERSMRCALSYCA
jgi:hypothetical protein